MSKIRNWLYDEPRGKRLFAFLIKVSVLDLAYAIIIGLSVGESEPTANGQAILEGLKHFLAEPSVLVAVLFLLVIVIEEVLFRYIPLSLTAWATKGSLSALLIVGMASSVLFGLVHDVSWQSLFAQGIGGIIYSAVFLKCGGLMRRPLKGLACTVVLHTAYNLTLLSAGAIGLTFSEG